VTGAAAEGKSSVARSISVSYASGITLTSTTDSPITITCTINASADSGLLGRTYYGWTVENSGTVIALAGIDLKSTVTVTNDATGIVAGGTYEVVLRGGVATVSNAGTITASDQ